MAKSLANLEGSAVDPDEDEEERQKRMQQTLHDAQEGGKDYGAGFHVGQQYIGDDGWLYRRTKNGNVRVMFLGKGK